MPLGKLLTLLAIEQSRTSLRSTGTWLALTNFILCCKYCQGLQPMDPWISYDPLSSNFNQKRLVTRQWREVSGVMKLERLWTPPRLAIYHPEITHLIKSPYDKMSTGVRKTGVEFLVIVLYIWFVWQLTTNYCLPTFCETDIHTMLKETEHLTVLTNMALRSLSSQAWLSSKWSNIHIIG